MNLHAFGKANCLVAHSFGNYCWDFVRRIRERREARRSARRKSAGTPGEPCRVDSSLRQLTDSETQAKKEVCLGRWPENSTGAAQQGTATVGGSRSSFVFTGHACVGKQKQERNDSSTSARHARDEDSGKPSGVAAQGRHDAAQLASLQSVSTTGPGTGRELCRVIVPKESWDKDHSDGADNPSEPSRSSADGHKFSSQGKEADKEKDVSELEEALSSEEDWDESDHWALWAEGNEVRGSEEKNNTRKRVSDEEVVNECCLVLKRMFNLRKKPWPIQAIVTRWDEDPLYYCSYGFPSKVGSGTTVSQLGVFIFARRTPVYFIFSCLCDLVVSTGIVHSVNFSLCCPETVCSKRTLSGLPPPLVNSGHSTSVPARLPSRPFGDR